MTKKTKEAIKASAAIVIALLAIFFLWIYPLNQAGKIVNRPETETPPANPADYGLAYDTVSFLTEDNIPLSGMILMAGPKPVDSTGAVTIPPTDSIRGMVILLHGLFDDAASQMDKAAALVKAGYRIVIYDQRGYGQSGGKHRSGGYYEGNDLQEVLHTLSLEDRLIHPLLVWGEDQGGSAALKAWVKDERIDYVVAENPVANGRDWQKRVRDHDNRSAPDLMMGLIWWWMKQKSGYEMSLAASDISDAIGSAIVNHPDRFLIFACGADDTPANPYLAELKDMGGQWMILSCTSGESLFAQHEDQMLPAVLKLIQ